MKRICTRENLWERISKQFLIGDGCWMWTGRPDGNNYSRVTVDGKRSYGHIAMYELFVGPIPEGMTIDHLCHTNDPDCPGGSDDPHRLCVRPDHLEAVTLEENKRRGRSPAAVHARKTHCPQGHEYTEENTYWVMHNGKRRPSRRCRICMKAQLHAAYLRRKARGLA